VADEFRGASRQKLEELYVLLLDALLARFRSGRVSAAYAMVARKVLKDSGTSASVGTQQDLLKNLEQLRSLSLPFTDTTKKGKPQ
jgi:hypothetical protein